MNINEIKAQEAKEAERGNNMTAIERLQHFVNGNYIGKLDLNRDIETLIEDYKLQEQYVKQLGQDKENMKKIINILCGTISQLI